MHPSELGDRLVVGLQTSQQPHHFHVALALGLQPPRRPHLPQIPVQVQLQQITRIVARSSRLRRLGTHKAQLRHVQPPNERLHDSTYVVDWKPALQTTMQFFKPLHRLDSVYFRASGGTTFHVAKTGVPPFTLGGPLQLSAYGTNEIFTNQYMLFQLGYLRQVGQLPPILGNKVYFSSLYELARP